MKKCSVLFSFLLMFCLCFSHAFAETEGDFAYSIHDGAAKITGYTGSASVLTIPDRLGGYPVTAIGVAAFRGCSFLTQITLPDSVTSLSRNAFEGCTALSQFTIPDSLKRIGDFAFKGCAALSQLTFHDNLEYVNLYAFYGCTAVRLCSRSSQTALTLFNSAYSFCDPDYPQLSLIVDKDAPGMRTFTVADCDPSAGSVSFPDGTTSIANSAFYNCTALTQITLPDSVTQIGHSAFARCAALTEIVIPASVASIASDVFSGCTNLTIVAPAGSAGQAYAEANSIAWRSL